jgi:hypothetical protein
MTKAEIKEYLGRFGGAKSYPVPARIAPEDAKRIPKVWDEAIAQHRKETGIALHRGCGSCHKRVWEWLQK